MAMASLERLPHMPVLFALPRPPEQKVSRKFREKVSTTFLKLRQQQQDDPTLRRKLRRLSSKR